MAYIENRTIEEWKGRIAASNSNAMRPEKRHRYPPHEGAFLLHCYTLEESDCPASCFCRKVGGGRVWTLRPDVTFDTFLDYYAVLWVGGSVKFRALVSDPAQQTFARWATAVSLLRAIKMRWSNWDGRGSTLAQLVSRVKRCYFCDDAFDQISPFVHTIRGLCTDRTGLYTSKLISQLFYDIAVPFDSDAAQKQRQRGYDPLALGGGAMQEEARRWLLEHNLSISDFRRLDDAPAVHWRPDEGPKADTGTTCSRVLDKLFYG